MLVSENADCKRPLVLPVCNWPLGPSTIHSKGNRTHRIMEQATVRPNADTSGGLVLTTKELQQLTGYRHVARMVDWLRVHQWVFELPVIKGESPRVSRDYFQRRLVDGQAVTVRTASRSGAPNFDVFTKASRRRASD